jgi:hypothetical protein
MKKKPEFIRKFYAIFDSFVFFDFISFILSFAILGVWIALVVKSYDMEISLPTDDTSLYGKFYEINQLIVDYSDMVAFNMILLAIKMLGFMKKSKSMNLLTRTLQNAKGDIFYFLVILSFLLLGFVGMAHISFGVGLKDFSTFDSSIRKCFEIIIGKFK